MENWKQTNKERKQRKKHTRRREDYFLTHARYKPQRMLEYWFFLLSLNVNASVSDTVPTEYWTNITAVKIMFNYTGYD